MITHKKLVNAPAVVLRVSESENRREEGKHERGEEKTREKRGVGGTSLPFFCGILFIVRVASWPLFCLSLT